MTKPVTIVVNGTTRTANVEARTSLGDFLREHCNLTGTHFGCEHGVCGACTVLVNGNPMRSCLVYAVQADACRVDSVEGFAEDDVMDALRAAFSEHHALQCGFCTPGMLVTARDIITRLGAVDEQRIREELSGNLCRCTGYVGIVRAIQDVACQFPAGVARPSHGAVQVLLEDAAPRSAAAPSAPPTTPPARKTWTGASPPLSPAKGADIRGSKGGGITVSQSFVAPFPQETVWDFFGDPAAVASCLPGAELIAQEGEAIKGRIQVKVGPIKAQFVADATYTRDEAARTGLIAGSGKDSISNSRINGEMAFALKPAQADATEVSIVLTFTLQGLLAQFSRPALVKDFTGFMMSQFSANMARRLAGEHIPPATQQQLDMIRMVWMWLKSLWRR